MKMTIDEALRVIKCIQPTKPTTMNGIMKKNALAAAIDTMCKYMQIKQIFDMWNDFRYEDDDVLAMTSDILYKIEEVDDIK